jgi:putative spermidine/putrescine transport system permease protein
MTKADPVDRISRVFAWSAAFLVLAPLPVLLAVSTSPNWQRGLWAGGFTLKWLLETWERTAPIVVFSVQLALMTLLIDLAIGLPASWVLARRNFWGRQLLLALTALPVAVPGIAIGLGLILAYPMLKAGGWLLVVGHILYTLPFVIGSLTPVLGDAKLREQEAVAKTLGANGLQSVLFVTLPQLQRTLTATAVMVFTLSMGEFNVSFFLFTPSQKPLPVELYSGYITGRLEVAAAATVWFLLFVIPAAILIERLGGSRLRGQA